LANKLMSLFKNLERWKNTIFWYSLMKY